MRDIEWDTIQEGDTIEYLPKPSRQEPDPKPRRFMVFKLIEGKVQAIRALRNHNDEEGSSFAEHEMVIIESNSDRWTYCKVKSKVVLTGGFKVTRAATGETEYDKCPTDLDKSRANKPTRKDTEPV